MEEAEEEKMSVYIRSQKLNYQQSHSTQILLFFELTYFLC